MKSFFLLSVLFISSALSCSYVSNTNDTIYIDGEWMNFVDNSGNTWYFNTCPSEIDQSENPCSADSAVCVSFKGTDKIIGAGLIDNYLSNAFENGVELDFASSTDCYSDLREAPSRKMKTSIQLLCSDSYTPVYSVNTDGCYSVITVNSSSYCGSEVDFIDGNEITIQHYHVRMFHFGFFMVVSLGFLATVCLCCCCVARRRRCRQRMQAKKHLASTAFQPVPHQNGRMVALTQQQIPMVQVPQQQQQQQQQQQNFPLYNPYLVQPQQQFVYYYPTHQQQQQQVPPMVPLDVTDSDEKLARELQAQFNRESNV